MRPRQILAMMTSQPSFGDACRHPAETRFGMASLDATPLEKCQAQRLRGFEYSLSAKREGYDFAVIAIW
jgi:hypothetical protein